MIRHLTGGHEVTEKNGRDCQIRVFWGVLAPRDHPIFTSDFNKDFEPHPKTANYAMYSELTCIIVILLSIIFKEMGT